MSEILHRCLDSKKAMSVEDGVRSMEDFLAERWKWVWTDDGEVLSM